MAVERRPAPRRRAEPRRRATVDTGRHRAAPRPRYARIGWLGAAMSVSAVALLAGWGVLPDGDDGTARDLAAAAAEPTSTPTPAPTPAPRPSVVPAPTLQAEPSATPSSTALPAGSGEGRRVVFSEAAQRVWLVDDDETVLRTYPVSGSTLDNLDPGTYSVYSRSEDAVGIDDSGTMEWFVRFTRGPSGAAIGFHTIPVKDGEPVQTVRQLGTPRSHGCIRQAEADALALWDFAPLGTTVVVV